MKNTNASFSFEITTFALKRIKLDFDIFYYFFLPGILDFEVLFQAFYAIFGGFISVKMFVFFPQPYYYSLYIDEITHWKCGKSFWI